MIPSASWLIPPLRRRTHSRTYLIVECAECRWKRSHPLGNIVETPQVLYRSTEGGTLQYVCSAAKQPTFDDVLASPRPTPPSDFLWGKAGGGRDEEGCYIPVHIEIKPAYKTPCHHTALRKLLFHGAGSGKVRSHTLLRIGFYMSDFGAGTKANAPLHLLHHILQRRCNLDSSWEHAGAICCKSRLRWTSVWPWFTFGTAHLTCIMATPHSCFELPLMANRPRRCLPWRRDYKRSTQSSNPNGSGKRQGQQGPTTSTLGGVQGLSGQRQE